MTYTIRPSAEVEFTKAPTIAVAGETGSGKTESALRIARGYVGPKGKFLVIDTEEKRALYKRARYQPWDWMDLQPPFTPANYLAALQQGKTYDAVVLDSGSHEYAGEGGMQDMHDEDLERMAKGDAAKMERLNALAWKRPKFEHKRLMAKLIRYPVLLIVCLRAEPKIKFIKNAEGKTQIVDAGFQPICEKMFGYELLVYALMHADNPGVPVHLKKLESDLEPVFIAGKQIDESTGERLAEWASTRSAAPQTDRAASSSSVKSHSSAEAADCISIDQATELEDALREGGKSKDRLLANVSRQYGHKIERLIQIRPADFADAMEYARGA